MKEIKIHSEYITLGQLIKFLGIVNTGGEIKVFLSENSVFVNEMPENRRGKKLYPGDFVQISSEKFKIV